jgi:hypothetical protein
MRRAMKRGDEFIFRMHAQAKCGLLCDGLVTKSAALFSRMNRARPNT